MRQLITESTVKIGDYTYEIDCGKQTIINMITIESCKKVWDKIQKAKLMHHTFHQKQTRIIESSLKN